METIYSYGSKKKEKKKRDYYEKKRKERVSINLLFKKFNKRTINKWIYVIPNRRLILRSTIHKTKPLVIVFFFFIIKWTLLRVIFMRSKKTENKNKRSTPFVIWAFYSEYWYISNRWKVHVVTNWMFDLPMQWSTLI